MKTTSEPKTAFIIVFLSILSAFLTGGVITWFGVSYAESHQKIITFISFIVGQTFMIVPLIVFLKFKKLPLFHSVRFKVLKYSTIKPVILFSTGLIILSDEVDRIIQLFVPTPEYVLDLNYLLKPESFLGATLLFIAVVILAPLGEEIVFRGFLQQILEKHWKDITQAILFTSLIFSLIHMNPYWFVQIYFLGVILGFLAWKTKSIIAPLILHSLNNSMALLLSSSDLQQNNFYLWNGHVAPWILIFACFSVFFGFKQINQTNLK
ncbi:MAG: lysostaphin resistance A-like protein [Candidatus Neomarinimicrobiota bacterium]